MADINMDWVERLRAPRYLWSQIAAHNPQRGILCREQESQQQLLTWDVETGERHPLTPPVPYALNATLSPDGEFVTYLTRHPTHSEVFQYVRVPYAGGTPVPMALTALMYASPHIEEAANARIGFTAVGGNGYSVQVWTPTSAKPLFSFESEVLAYGPALSADGTIAVVATLHSDTSESTHLEAYNIDTGEKISQLELPDTPLEAVKFAPALGDSRLLVQAREGMLMRPLVWDVRTGTIDRVGESPDSYTAWDWHGTESLLVEETHKGTHLRLYDLRARSLRPQWGELVIPLDLAYSLDHDKDFVLYHGGDSQSIFIKYDSSYGRSQRLISPETSHVQPMSGSLPGLPFMLNFSTADPKRTQVLQILSQQPTDRSFSVPVIEAAAWHEQIKSWTGLHIWQIFTPPVGTFEMEALRRSRGTSTLKPLLVAHNMAAALALLALHHDESSLWAGGVIVRPILDWVHLYDNVSPPEQAMMRLWFGGSPTDAPHAWRAASPLRQTTPLTVPVKLLYHPHDALTPIQHIQTYAANNPTVELIDISRDLVGPAHQQQERLITRMLEAGLPLLKGTS